MLVDHRCRAAGACPGLNARVQAILNPNSSIVRSASFLRGIEQLLSDIKSISLINPAGLDKHTRRPRNFSECKAINLTLRSSSQDLLLRVNTISPLCFRLEKSGFVIFRLLAIHAERNLSERLNSLSAHTYVYRPSLT